MKGHLTMTKDELGTLVMSLQDRIYRVTRAVLHHRGGVEETPKHFYIATRFVRDGDRFHDKPPEYTDEVELEK